jgi:hypothetical protein
MSQQKGAKGLQEAIKKIGVVSTFYNKSEAYGG